MEYSQQTLSPEILAEQKAYKASKDSFRAVIKTLSEQQVLLKNQRKTKTRDLNLPVVTVPTFYDATSWHHENRNKLRHLHIAYAVFRGKAIPEEMWKYTKESGIIRIAPDLQSVRITKPNIKLVEKYLQEHVTQSTYTYPSS